MKNIRYNIIAICCVAAFALSLSAGKKPSVDSGNQRKAEYLYLEAMVKHTEGDEASFHDLISKAHELDPGNSVIGYYYGFSNLLRDNLKKDNVDFPLSLMKKHFNSHPENFYENYIYALACKKAGQGDEALKVWETLLKEYPAKVQLYPLIADSYAGKGDFRKAIAAYDSLERSEGRSDEITVRKVGYMFALNDTASAIREGRSLLDEAPGNLSYNVLMGDIFLQLNNTDSAMVYYDKAQSIDPDNGYVNLSKANVYDQLGDSVNYEKEITTAVLNKNIDVAAKINIMTSYIRQCIQDNDSSARVDNMFRVVLDQHPHEADILKLYCDYLTFKHDYKNAAEQLSYALDINPADEKSWERLMWLYLYQKEARKAIEAGEKALSYNPDDLVVYQIMGSAYYQLEDYQKSLDAYNKVLEKNKDLHMVNESDIYSSMAESYSKMGDTAKCFASYEKAIEISPNNYLALNNYAYFLCLTGNNLDKAEMMSKEAVDSDPENVSYLDTYAWICFLKRDYKTALEYIKKAFDENADEDPTAELFEHYGDILFMNGDPDGALVQWKEALKLNPESKLLKRKVENKTYFYE